MDYHIHNCITAIHAIYALASIGKMYGNQTTPLKISLQCKHKFFYKYNN